ncbi:MAG: SGNH/GDSL hydrolase family protein [Bacteroidales bacterium]|nr:SGNH/GDSL hydrolase family protein [Bacteroidales bacterium]
MKRLIYLCALTTTMSIFSCSGNAPKNAEPKHWLATWGTAVQLTEPHNMPPAPGLSGNTIRQRVKVTLGGDSLRLKLSNEFGDAPLKISAVSIANSIDSCAIDPASATNVLFDNKPSLEIPVGATVISDPLALSVKNRGDVAITIVYENVPEKLTGHPGSRTTSFIMEGNHLNDANFSNSVKTDHWYSIERIDILTSVKNRAVAIIGNSITDGRGSTTNMNNRWPDVFTERLLADSATKNLSVLNMGIGGNCVVFGGLGPTASKRYSRDVLDQPGVKYVVIFEGVNDIGGSRDVAQTEQALKDAYTKMINEAKAKGLIVYGATITPFKESFYYTPEKEQLRQNVNNWIRTCGLFDTVIDLETAICSKEDPFIMDSTLHDNDHLHPNADGHRALGNFVDINLFKK